MAVIVLDRGICCNDDPDDCPECGFIKDGQIVEGDAETQKAIAPAKADDPEPEILKCLDKTDDYLGIAIRDDKCDDRDKTEAYQPSWLGKTKWSRYRGPLGGEGWVNTITGEIRYQDDHPGYDSGYSGVPRSTEQRAVNTVRNSGPKAVAQAAAEHLDASPDELLNGPNKGANPLDYETRARYVAEYAVEQAEEEGGSDTVRRVLESIGDLSWEERQEEIEEWERRQDEARERAQNTTPSERLEGHYDRLEELAEQELEAGNQDRHDEIMELVTRLRADEEELGEEEVETIENTLSARLDGDVTKTDGGPVTITASITRKAEWQPYEGPQGGEGWLNPQTGEVRYQEQKPTDDGTDDDGATGTPTDSDQLVDVDLSRLKTGHIVSITDEEDGDQIVRVTGHDDSIQTVVEGVNQHGEEVTIPESFVDADKIEYHGLVPQETETNPNEELPEGKALAHASFEELGTGDFVAFEHYGDVYRGAVVGEDEGITGPEYTIDFAGGMAEISEHDLGDGQAKPQLLGRVEDFGAMNHDYERDEIHPIQGDPEEWVEDEEFPFSPGQTIVGPQWEWTVDNQYATADGRPAMTLAMHNGVTHDFEYMDGEAGPGWYGGSGSGREADKKTFYGTVEDPEPNSIGFDPDEELVEDSPIDLHEAADEMSNRVALEQDFATEFDAAKSYAADLFEEGVPYDAVVEVSRHGLESDGRDVDPDRDINDAEDIASNGVKRYMHRQAKDHPEYDGGVSLGHVDRDFKNDFIDDLDTETRNRMDTILTSWASGWGSMVDEDTIPLYDMAAEEYDNDMYPTRQDPEELQELRESRANDIEADQQAIQEYREKTVEAWRETYGDTIPVFRGYNPDDHSKGKEAREALLSDDSPEEVEVRNGVANSWSTDPTVAYKFSTWTNDDEPGIIVRQEIPVERIWATSDTGPSLMDEETEVIVGHPEEVESFDRDDVYVTENFDPYEQAEWALSDDGDEKAADDDDDDSGKVLRLDEEWELNSVDWLRRLNSDDETDSEDESGNADGGDGATAKSDRRRGRWQRYTGPRGGTGWVNERTGEVVYQDERPGRRSTDIDPDDVFPELPRGYEWDRPIDDGQFYNDDFSYFDAEAWDGAISGNQILYTDGESHELNWGRVEGGTLMETEDGQRVPAYVLEGSDETIDVLDVFFEAKTNTDPEYEPDEIGGDWTEMEADDIVHDLWHYRRIDFENDIETVIDKPQYISTEEYGHEGFAQLTGDAHNELYEALTAYFPREDVQTFNEAIWDWKNDSEDGRSNRHSAAFANALDIEATSRAEENGTYNEVSDAHVKIAEVMNDLSQRFWETHFEDGAKLFRGVSNTAFDNIIEQWFRNPGAEEFKLEHLALNNYTPDRNTANKWGRKTARVGIKATADQIGLATDQIANFTNENSIENEVHVIGDDVTTTAEDIDIFGYGNASPTGDLTEWNSVALKRLNQKLMQDYGEAAFDDDAEVPDKEIVRGMFVAFNALEAEKPEKAEEIAPWMDRFEPVVEAEYGITRDEYGTSLTEEAAEAKDLPVIDLTGPKDRQFLAADADPPADALAGDSSDNGAIKSVAKEWQPYEGPQGGQGWYNPQTNEVRYQEEKPTGDEMDDASDLDIDDIVGAIETFDEDDYEDGSWRGMHWSDVEVGSYVKVQTDEWDFDNELGVVIAGDEDDNEYTVVTESGEVGRIAEGGPAFADGHFHFASVFDTGEWKEEARQDLNDYRDEVDDATDDEDESDVGPGPQPEYTPPEESHPLAPNDRAHYEEALDRIVEDPRIPFEEHRNDDKTEWATERVWEHYKQEHDIEVNLSRAKDMDQLRRTVADIEELRDAGLLDGIEEINFSNSDLLDSDFEGEGYTGVNASYTPVSRDWMTGEIISERPTIELNVDKYHQEMTKSFGTWASDPRHSLWHELAHHHHIMNLTEERDWNMRDIGDEDKLAELADPIADIVDRDVMDDHLQPHLRFEALEFTAEVAARHFAGEDLPDEFYDAVDAVDGVIPDGG